MTSLFGLTGGGTAVLAVLLMLGLSVALLLSWERLRVLGRWSWAARAGLLGGAQLAAVLVTALLLNNVFVFYQSWSELLGAHPRAAQPSAPAGAIDSRLAATLKANAAAGVGTVTSLVIPGRRSGIRTGPALVYLPPEYGNPGYASRSFPVLELLDGFPGSPATWTRTLHLATVMNELVDSGRVAPFIVVMPVQNVASPHDTECVNVSHGPQVETYLTYDVRAAVTQQLRASQASSQWAVMGDSTGGYCASDLALRHPSLFSAAVSIAGYNAPAHDATTGNLFGSDPARAAAFSPSWLVQHQPGTPVHLLLISTRSDRTSYRSSQQLIALARPPVYLSTLTLPRGGHNFATFAAELPAALGWVSRFVAPPLAPIPTVDGLTPQPVGPGRGEARTRHPIRQARAAGPGPKVRLAAGR